MDNGHKADSRPTQKQTNIRLLIYIGYNRYIIKINWYILSISFRINFRISNLPGLFLVQIMICRPLYNFWSQGYKGSKNKFHMPERERERAETRE